MKQKLKIKLKREELKNKLLKNQNDFINKNETHYMNKLKTIKMDISLYMLMMNIYQEQYLIKNYKKIKEKKKKKNN